MIKTGSVIAGYRIDGLIGRGGMGVVYKATQMSLNRAVALKVLDESFSKDDTFRQRFKREGMIQAGMDHPNIVTVYEAGESEHGLWLAMRIVKGNNLKDMILEGAVPPKLTVRLLSQVGEALEAAHESGLVHRDIKPQNILVAGRKHAYLADFGLTKAMGEQGLTRTGQFVGTLDYISPEQIQGLQPTGKSDIYALGAVLYECLSGAVPYPKPSDAAILFAHVSDPAPSLHKVRPDLPQEIDGVIAKAMSKDPDERYSSGVEMMEEVDHILASMQTTRPPSRGTVVSGEFGGTSGGWSEPNLSPSQAGDQSSPGFAASGASAPGVIAPSGPTSVPGVDHPSGPGSMPGPGHPSGPTSVPGVDHPSGPGSVPNVAVSPQPSGPGTATAKGTVVRPNLDLPPTTPVPAPAWQAPPQQAWAPPQQQRTETKAAPTPLLVGAAVGLLILAVVAFLLGSSGGDAGTEPASGGTRTVSSGTMSMTVSNDFKEDDSLDTGGVDFQQPILLALGKESGLVAGQVDAEGPTLLADSLVKDVKSLGQPEPVRLGDLEAYRYAGLKVADTAGTVTVYVVPTTEGVATIACGGTAASIFDKCEAAATTLELKGATAFRLGPSQPYAQLLNNVLGTLDSERADGRSALSRAGSSSEQAKAADDLAAAYKAAATRLTGFEISPESAVAADELLAALTATQKAYEDLAAAARSENQGAFDAARGRVDRGESQVQAALKDLKDLGYNVR